MEIRKAVRRKAKLRLGIAGPSGSGKTYSALLVAFGLDAGKVGLIDTEHGSGDLYAHLGDYDVVQLEPPYTVAKYRQALNLFEAAGYGVVILDSISHAWAGEGGLLDKHGKITDSGTKKDSFAAWRMVTPDHNSFIDAMLSSPCHIIATMRSKTEYVLVESERNGRKVMEPKKVGLAPIQRDGMEYEFTAMFDLSTEHIATASKDRTGLFDGEYLKPDQKLGARFKSWLESGIDEVLPSTTAVDDDLNNDLNSLKTATDISTLRLMFLSTKGKWSNKPVALQKLIETKDKRKTELETTPPVQHADFVEDEFVREMVAAEARAA